MAETDRLSAALDEIRQRSESPVSHVGSLPIAHDGVRGLMESAADVPRLLAALDAVLKLAAGWEQNALEVPLLNREAAALAVQAQVRAALLGEDDGNWVRTGTQFGYTESLDGVDWSAAPNPPVDHDHTPQTRTVLRGEQVEYCACGERRHGTGEWSEGNSHRPEVKGDGHG